MSFYRNATPSPLRAVILDIAEPSLHDLVTVLLHQWGVEPFPPYRETLHILASADGTGLTLRPSGKEDERLPLPASLEALWLALQRHLYDLPRLHFRSSVSLQGKLKSSSDEACDFHTLSLSDDGVRFEFFRELERETEVAVELLLDEERVSLKGKVVYCVETRGSGRMITGVAFHEGERQQRLQLRNFLVVEALRRARQVMDRERFDRALAYLDLAPEILKYLGSGAR